MLKQRQKKTAKKKEKSFHKCSQRGRERETGGMGGGSQSRRVWLEYARLELRPPYRWAYCYRCCDSFLQGWLVARRRCHRGSIGSTHRICMSWPKVEKTVESLHQAETLPHCYAKDLDCHLPRAALGRPVRVCAVCVWLKLNLLRVAKRNLLPGISRRTFCPTLAPSGWYKLLNFATSLSGNDVASSRPMPRPGVATLHNQRNRDTATASESTLPPLFDRRLSVLTVALRVESVSGLSLQPLARDVRGRCVWYYVD